MRKSLYLLGSVTDEDVEWIIGFGQRRLVSAGTVLIKQGQPIEDLFLILEGSFSVSDERAGDREIARLGSGEIVGEMSFVDASPPSATVTAVGDGSVLALSRQLLRQKLDEDTGFAARFYYALAVFLSDRLRATASRLGNGTSERDLDEQIIQDDELDPNVLDNVHLAGARFKRIVERMSRENA